MVACGTMQAGGSTIVPGRPNGYIPGAKRKRAKDAERCSNVGRRDALRRMKLGRAWFVTARRPRACSRLVSRRLSATGLLEAGGSDELEQRLGVSMGAGGPAIGRSSFDRMVLRVARTTG